MSRRRDGGRGRDGFTLIELLVAMTILALLAGIMFGGFRFGARAWERVQVHVDQASELQIVQSFLRRRLGAAVPVLRPGNNPDSLVQFDGAATRLSFVTVMPVYLQTGGYSILELSLERGREGGELVLRWRPYHFGDEEGSPDEGDERVLVAGVERVELAYFGPVDDVRGGAAWQSRWQGRRQLPELVRIRLEYAGAEGRRWPELVAAPMVIDNPRWRR